MATIKHDIKQEIIRFCQREDAMDACEVVIAYVRETGGVFGGMQREVWLDWKQECIQLWMDEYLGHFSSLTTWEEMDNWAEESDLPVPLIIKTFGRLCKDGDGRKPSKGSVLMAIKKLQERIENIQGATATIKGKDVFVKLGGIDWRVLAVENNKVLLLSDKILERSAYLEDEDEDESEYYKSICVTWEFCTLREYLNGEFYDRLGIAKSAIAETRNNNPYNHWYGTNGGNATTDKVFLLSLEELVKYFGDSGHLKNKARKGWPSRPAEYFGDSGHKKNKEKNDWWSRPVSYGKYVSDRYNRARIARDKGGEAHSWWLRSPGKDPSFAACVESNGLVGVSGVFRQKDMTKGVRPALWLNLKHENDCEEPQSFLQKFHVLHKRKLKELISNIPETTATIESGSVFVRLGGIDWRVLAVENNKALLISEKILESRPYVEREDENDEYED